jgi:hypothetical protein
MSERIQRKRTKGWRMPEGAVYVGRPSMWGNPFKTAAEFKEAISEFPVPQDRFRKWTEAGGNASWLVLFASRSKPILNWIKGKDLACWCPLDQPCHADVLLELANPR